MLGSGGVGSVGGVVTEVCSVTATSVLCASVGSSVGRGSEGSVSGVRSAGAVVWSALSSSCADCSVVMPLSSCSDMFRGGEVVASGTLVTGLGAESRAPVSVGSLTGGAEVAATGASYVVGPASSEGMSGRSTVSTVCCPVVS